VRFVVQADRRGTGHAVQQAEPLLRVVATRCWSSRPTCRSCGRRACAG
jgi:hypothetical protein